jgi:hypothetical protein
MNFISAAAAGIVGMMIVSSGTSSWAGSKIQAIGTTIVHGAVEYNANQNRDPWVAQVFSAGNECLRLAVTAQGADLEATLVSPSGQVWQDDDGNTSLRPLIKARTTLRGWYPLTLHSWSGALINVDFTLVIRRLATTDPLCNPPTPIRIAAPEAAKPRAGAGAAPRGGAN